MQLKYSIRHIALFAVLFGLAGCAGNNTVLQGATVSAPPPLLVGGFVDDYGINYSISAREWRQQPDVRYQVVQWYADGHYLIARNDAANPSDPGLFTRIDWMPLPGMPPWEWAFCLSAYKAPTAAEAKRTDIARRQTPLTGCNGHPFSRMQRTAPAD